MYETPFILAVNYNKLETLKLLILHGCDIEKYYHESPLSVACHNRNCRIAKFLLSEGYRVELDKSFRQIVFNMEAKYPELFELLNDKYENPRPCSLKQICRLRVRHSLGEDLITGATLLDLPKTLETYVVSDIIY